MSDQTGPTPDDEPTAPDSGGSVPPPPPPPPPSYGQQPPPQPPSYGEQAPPPSYGNQPYGQPPAYGQPPGYSQMPGYGAPTGSPPPNYLVWSILSTVLCCLPLGVVSIVFAAQVNSKWAAGDVTGAQNSSDKARLFAILSAVIGLVIGIPLFAIRASS